MAFPQNFLDELMARNDILDVVGSYVSLQPKGGSYWGCCPFHNEKTPSFHVLQDKQYYHCFGCKKGGGVINFIMDMENLSYPDAIRFLAKRVNMAVPEDRESDDSSRLRARLLELNRDAARYYYNVLQTPDGAAVQAYLNRRRIQRPIAVRFGMGAAKDGWDHLMKAMLEKGYSKQELLKAGLIVQNKNGGFYDKFRNRLILPVVDIRGDVVGFGSRVLDKSEPKYMNTSETPVYSKRRVLYGLNLAKKTKRPNIILCEGNLDVVTLHQAGFDNAVASMGTALTVEQTRLLSRYTKELVLCYDNDNAGQMATKRALEILQNSEFSVHVLQLPQRLVDGAYIKQDADDFIKFQGADAFERLLSGSENGIEFRMSQVAAKYNLKDDAQRVAYADEISQVLCTLENAVEREVYTVRASETAGLTPTAMRSEVERAFKKKRKQEKWSERKRELNPITTMQPAQRELRYTNLRSALAEEGVIRLLMRDDDLFGNAKPICAENFSSPVLGKIFSLLWAEHEAHQNHSMAVLSGALTPDEMSHFTAILQKPESSNGAEQALQDYIRIIQEESSRQNPESELDALSAAKEKFKSKKGYGGKKA